MADLRRFRRDGTEDPAGDLVLWDDVRDAVLEGPIGRAVAQAIVGRRIASALPAGLAGEASYRLRMLNQHVTFRDAGRFSRDTLLLCERLDEIEKDEADRCLAENQRRLSDG